MVNPITVNELMDYAYRDGAFFAEAKIANRRPVPEGYTMGIEFDLARCAKLGEFELLTALVNEFKAGMEQEAKIYGLNADDLIGD